MIGGPFHPFGHIPDTGDPYTGQDVIVLRPESPMALPVLESQSIASPATSLVGRASDLARLRDLLDRPDVRLVTLLGPGGVGKTRLGFQLLQDIATTCTLEPCVVLLASSSTEDEAVATIARALGVPYAERQLAPRVIADAIGQRPMLLLLDNVEQLATQLDLLPGLLTACQNLTIVTTSRVPLRFSAERVFPVEPLSTTSQPGQAAPAVELFIDRAQAVRPDLELSPTNQAAIEEICQRLDGLPLAIELAAARTRFLPPETLLERLPARLQVLDGGPRDAPERHRTLRATIAWSYDLLNPEERLVFERLSVFSNGGPLDAAATVGDPAGNLSQPVDGIVEALVDHSLVRLNVSNGQPRFRMLHTIREFAQETLESREDAHQVRLAHAIWFANLVLEEPSSTWRTGTPEQRNWIAKALPDASNFSMALKTLTREGRFDLAAGMAGTLITYWTETGQVREAEHWMRQMEPHVDKAPLAHQANFRRMQAVMRMHRKDLDQAMEAAQQAIGLNRELNDARMAANNQHLLGQILWAAGRDDEAEATTRAAMAAMVESGDPLGGALYASQLADGLMQRGNFPEAERLLLDAEPIVAEHRPGALPLLHGSLGVLYLLRDDLDRASTYLERSLDYHGTPPYQTPLLLACRLETIGYLASRRGRHHDALHLLGAGTALLERHGGLMDQVWLDDQATILAAAETELPAAEIIAARALGATMLSDLSRALDQARTILALRGEAESVVPSPTIPELEEQLTPREIDVLQLLASGRSNPAIAEALFISPRTVTTHLSRLYAKLGVNSRTEAVATGMRLGLIARIQ